jgi:hypothetical protein
LTLASEARFVKGLYKRLEQVEGDFETSVEEDELLLRSSEGLTAWQRAATVYRLERKKIATAARLVLDVYGN